MEIIQQNNIKPNYQYLCDKYILPEWFDHRDIDWVRYYPMKDDKMYKCNTKMIIKTDLKYIYDDEKVNTHTIFVKYLSYINRELYNITIVNDITEEDIQKLLNIKICDYDWNFMWSTPIYDKNSEELLLREK